jgi:integrase
MDNENQSKAVVPFQNGKTYNKSTQMSAIQRSEGGTADYVPHLQIGDIKAIVIAAGQKKRHGERNALLIKLLYDGALRVSEGIGVRPCDITRDATGWSVSLLGKGGKAGVIAISASLAAELGNYCYRNKMPETAKIFPISRSQVFRIVSQAFDKSGVRKPGIAVDHVGCVHALRHSGAIQRLLQTGNPKAVQDQLRHKSARMTLRYLKTLSYDESLRIQQGVDFHW